MDLAQPEAILHQNITFFQGPVLAQIYKRTYVN
ncbi:MAG: hypothetical protein ACI9FB_004223 [Candidatus Azotimanducaceae bacterium]